MKAARLVGPGRISIDEVPTPEPGSGEVLLKVSRVALCGTDQRVFAGEKHVDVEIVGHEVSGDVAAVGPGVEGVPAGKRYAIQTVVGCGECRACRRGEENLCVRGFDAIGYQWNGGFAQFMIVPARAVAQGCLIDLPDDVDDDGGAIVEPLSCCVNGMNHLPLERAEHVIIFGAGIIGVLNGLIARHRGAGRIGFVDVAKERLDLIRAMGLGFDGYFDGKAEDLFDGIREFTGGAGADAVVCAASAKQAVQAALKIVARNGHISLFAGLPKSDPVLPVDLNAIHYQEVHIHGANSSSHSEYIEAREMVRSGAIPVKTLITHRFDLDHLAEAVETQRDLARGALKILIHPWSLDAGV